MSIDEIKALCLIHPELFAPSEELIKESTEIAKRIQSFKPSFETDEYAHDDLVATADYERPTGDSIVWIVGERSGKVLAAIQQFQPEIDEVQELFDATQRLCATIDMKQDMLQAAVQAINADAALNTKGIFADLATVIKGSNEMIYMEEADYVYGRESRYRRYKIYRENLWYMRCYATRVRVLQRRYRCKRFTQTQKGLQDLLQEDQDAIQEA